ncbi:1988_t:CDS:10 [Funneliformis geosporum]|uniref:25_t:CDS:1 n=1 Tax=Funneliformis geosporum TaxID=1117311 RepID=A0A9W4SEQ5_9GLOM|nr:1988_t:CDS:10 [Funneliformis geosporum]CAI2165823.1 25_t:CDS:10 [Funneliformis geosporum]
MPPSAHKASEKAVNSKRAKRQTSSKPNYFEGNSSDIDSQEDYDPMMNDTAYDGGDPEFGIEPMRIDDDESMKRYDEREEGEASEEHRETVVDQKKEKKRQEILDRIEKLQKEFINKKDEIFKDSIRQIDYDIRTMREGTHPEYEERLQQLIDKREQTLEKARFYRDYRLGCVERMFDAEKRQVEDDYMLEKQGLKEQMLADMDERRKKLKEDYESFDITSDAAMDGNPRYHPQRKLRARQKEDTEVKVKKPKLEEIKNGWLSTGSNVNYVFDIKINPLDLSLFTFSTNSTTKNLSNDKIFITVTTCKAPLPNLNKNPKSPPAEQLEIWISTKIKNPGHLNVDIPKENKTGLYIGVFAPKLSDDYFGHYQFQIGASTKDFLLNLPTVKGLILDDTDHANALFRTVNTSSKQPLYDVTFVEHKYVDGISQSLCAYTENHLNSKNVTYMTKEIYGKLQSLISISNLKNGTKYSVLVKEESVNDPKFFVPIAFQTQSQNNCMIIKNLEFCDKVFYSVPKTISKITEQELAIGYDNLAKSYFNNFELTIDQYPCDDKLRSKYSLVRNCNDCKEAYKDWICAIIIPRCANEDSSDGIERNKSRVEVSDETMKIDQPFVEIPPCIDLCYNITRSCPESFGFSCPNSSKSTNSTNSTYGDTIDRSCNSLGMDFSSRSNLAIWFSIQWTLIILVIGFTILIVGI